MRGPLIGPSDTFSPQAGRRAIAALSAILFLAVSARADFREFNAIPVDPSIETKLRHAAEESLKEFPNLKADDLALSVVDLTKPGTPARADYHGDAIFYPASVIKIFFMADTYRTVKTRTPEMDRALKEMIVVSDNDATAFLVDILADTCPGPELEGRALRRFIEKRRTINERFARFGYTDNLSAMMKPWTYGPYGRDKQVLGPNRENRNKLTANAAAAFMLWVARGRAPSAENMMTLLSRPLDPPREEENQVKEFIGASLPPGSKLWSKAGWTSEVRHDVAYIELPDGRKLVLVIFTRGQADDLTLIPGIAKHALHELADIPPLE